LNVRRGARALTLALLLAGCDGASAPPIECTTSNILDGSPATLYPEGALLLMLQHGLVTGVCSGALIAPRVVLTAGHCVASYTAWEVLVPFVNQTATSAAGETFDWKGDPADRVIPGEHDVGLVYLDTPIDLPTYPALAGSAIEDGTLVVNIGRIHDGAVSGSMLFLSKPLAASSATTAGFPFDYLTNRVIELGDSGGPVELAGVTPHLIVAVNSGVAGGTELLARIDLLATWIQGRVAARGGGGGALASPAVMAAPPTASDCSAAP
jgi:hypothetical protein